MNPRPGLEALDRLMRQSGGMPPAPVPVPLHKMGAMAAQAATPADGAPVAVVIPFPGQIRQILADFRMPGPDWAAVDAALGDLGLLPPPVLRLVRRP